MKNAVVLFTVFLALLSASSCHLKAKKAKTYRDEILEQVKVVVDASLGFSDAVFTHRKQDAVLAVESYSSTVKKSITAVEAKGEFSGDTMLRAASLFLLNFYDKTLHTQYKPFYEKVNTDELSVTEAKAIDSITEKFMMDENHYWGLFDAAEKNFYRKNEIKKVEN
jgi:hypothetical protein